MQKTINNNETELMKIILLNHMTFIIKSHDFLRI